MIRNAHCLIWKIEIQHPSFRAYLEAREKEIVVSWKLPNQDTPIYTKFEHPDMDPLSYVERLATMDADTRYSVITQLALAQGVLPYTAIFKNV